MPEANFTQEQMKAATGAIPAGDYIMRVVEAEVAPNKALNGTNLMLNLEILSAGDYAGRRFKQWLCLQNPNAGVVANAWQLLGNLQMAIGVPVTDRDPNNLLNKKFSAKVLCKETDSFPNSFVDPVAAP